MTDMRATERLLEVIEEMIAKVDVRKLSWDEGQNLAEVLLVTAELRRRGDTLVRRDDLVRVLEGWSLDRMRHDPITPEDSAWEAAWQRLENVIGGKL